MAPSSATELGFDSPRMVQGKEPMSVPDLGWGGDFLVHIHENFLTLSVVLRSQSWLPLTHEARQLAFPRQL